MSALIFMGRFTQRQMPSHAGQAKGALYAKPCKAFICKDLL